MELNTTPSVQEEVKYKAKVEANYMQMQRVYLQLVRLQKHMIMSLLQ